MMIKCSMAELIFIDLMCKCDVTKIFRANFSDEEMLNIIKEGKEKIKKRQWFKNDKYSDEFVEFTKYLKLFQIANQEIALNNLVYHYRSESEEGILLNVLENDEIELGLVSKSEYFTALVKKLPAMLLGENEVKNDIKVGDMLRNALSQIVPQFKFTYTKDGDIQNMSIVRDFEGKILEEELISNSLKEVNSKYLRNKILGFLEVAYE